MYTLFDSAHLVNHLCFTGRQFAIGIDPAPAAEPIVWPEYHGPGRNPNPPTDADNSRDYTPRFIPSPEDHRFNAETSPLNHTRAELVAEADREFFDHYEPTAEDWAEYDRWASDNGQFGMTREE